ncbi:hypothetical protein ACQPZZ_05420 [Microbispora sp. CA-135349]|uniref:hypothetical protein n=1 Tax=Microbispora sp. CA-135349 TaxID=3239953 RepID=UPI003D925340
MTMSIETEPSTADLLMFADRRHVVEELGRVLKERRMLEEVGDRFRPGDAGFMSDVVRRVAESGGRLLSELDLGVVLLSGWTKYRALVDAGRRTMKPGAGGEPVRLYEHTITSEHKPWVAVLVNEEQVFRVDFGVTLEFVVASLDAYVADGRLEHLRAGDFTASITWTVRGFPVKKVRFARPIPVRVRLGGGIPLVAGA